MFSRGASRPGGTGLGPASLGIDFIIRPAFLQVAGCLRVATGDPDASVAQVRHAHSPSPFQWLPGSFSGPAYSAPKPPRSQDADPVSFHRTRLASTLFFEWLRGKRRPLKGESNV